MEGIIELELKKSCPLDDNIKQRWLAIEQMDNVFRYKLNVERSKVVPGKHNFYIEVW